MGFKILENAMKWKLAAAAALKGLPSTIYHLSSIAFLLTFAFLLLLSYYD